MPLLRLSFLINQFPFQATIPGAGPLPRCLVTVGGIQVHRGVDYSEIGRTLQIPSDLTDMKTIDVLDIPDGARTDFNIARDVVIATAAIMLNGVGQILSGASPEAAFLNTGKIRIFLPPTLGDLIQVQSLMPANFHLGSILEYREVP